MGGEFLAKKVQKRLRPTEERKGEKGDDENALEQRTTGVKRFLRREKKKDI